VVKVFKKMGRGTPVETLKKNPKREFFKKDFKVTLKFVYQFFRAGHQAYCEFSKAQFESLQ